MSDPHAPGSCEPGVHLTLYGCPLCSLPVHLKCKLQELGIGTVGCRMSLLRSVASGALRLFSFFFRGGPASDDVLVSSSCCKFSCSDAVEKSPSTVALQVATNCMLCYVKLPLFFHHKARHSITASSFKTLVFWGCLPFSHVLN